LRIKCSVTKINLILETLVQDLPGEIVPEFVEKLADAALDNAYKRAPWRSGFLAMSLTKKVDGNTAQVTPTASYAAFVSLGTRPHEIRPRNGKALAFPGGQLGGMVFAAVVNHPGTQPNPYLQLAAQDTREQALEIFHQIWINYAGL
jgi:hypothetical protein